MQVKIIKLPNQCDDIDFVLLINLVLRFIVYSFEQDLINNRKVNLDSEFY